MRKSLMDITTQSCRRLAHKIRLHMRACLLQVYRSSYQCCYLTWIRTCNNEMSLRVHKTKHITQTTKFVFANFTITTRCSACISIFFTNAHKLVFRFLSPKNVQRQSTPRHTYLKQRARSSDYFILFSFFFFCLIFSHLLFWLFAIFCHSFLQYLVFLL